MTLSQTAQTVLEAFGAEPDNGAVGRETFRGLFEAAAPYIAVTMLEAMEARIAKGAKARPSKTDESRAPASPTGVAKSRSSERLERAVALDGQINAPP